MSSYKQPYIPTHYNEYIPTVSAEDFKQGLQIKQQQFDQGWKTVQDNISQTENINVLRDDDKAYLDQRKQEITDTINKHNLDMSDPRNVYQLSSAISPIYKDKRILNAVEDTAKIYSLQKNIEDLEKNHPERYSSLNKNRDLRALKKYIDNPGSRYEGGTTPTLYSDYKKSILDIGAKLKPEIYDDPITGKRITGVSAERILSLLPAEDKQQMDIDMEESGITTTDINRIKTSYAEQNAQLEEYRNKLSPSDPKFLQIQKMIDDNNVIINSPQENEDVIIGNYNQHQKENFYKQYVNGVAYTQSITSPERLQQNAQSFQAMMHAQTLHDKKINDAWKMGYDVDEEGNYLPTKYPKLGGTNSTTPSGFHYMVDEYVKNLANEGDTIDLMSTGQEIPIEKEGNISTKIGRIVKQKDGKYVVYTHKIDTTTGKEVDGTVKELKDISISVLRDMYSKTRKLLPEEFNQTTTTEPTDEPTTIAPSGVAPTAFDAAFDQVKNEIVE